jgi:hypothetical protein
MSLVRTDVSEDCIASIMRVKRIGEPGTILAVASYCFVPSSPIHITLMTEAIRSSEMSVLTRVTARHISKGGILHNHQT